MQLYNIPVLKDNYIWLLVISQQQCIIIDPGEAAPILELLSRFQWLPTAILLTHHHTDHTAGVQELLNHYPWITVYGPTETLTTRQKTMQLVTEGTTITINALVIDVFFTPGHTLGHVVYYCRALNDHPPILFCGDTLFSGGCGRLLEGTAEQMYRSLQRLSQLPHKTQICAGHEYTLENLRFARSIDKKNFFLKVYQKKIVQLRAAYRTTLPSSLAIEKKINPFLRCHDRRIQKHLGFIEQPQELWWVFSALRQLKDHF